MKQINIHIKHLLFLVYFVNNKYLCMLAVDPSAVQLSSHVIHSHTHTDTRAPSDQYDED